MPAAVASASSRAAPTAASPVATFEALPFGACSSPPRSPLVAVAPATADLRVRSQLQRVGQNVVRPVHAKGREQPVLLLPGSRSAQARHRAIVVVVGRTQLHGRDRGAGVQEQDETHCRSGLGPGHHRLPHLARCVRPPARKAHPLAVGALFVFSHARDSRSVRAALVCHLAHATNSTCESRAHRCVAAHMRLGVTAE